VSRESLERALPAGDRLLLDTTALASYLDSSEATHPITRVIVDEFVASGRNAAVVSMITMMELLVRPLRAAPGAHRTILDFLRYHPNLDAVPLDLQMAQEAASLRATHGFDPPDALIIATGIGCQVGHLVTNDHRWAPKLQPIQDRVRVCQLDQHLPFP
jgi:predicted nucleic acid-binding protein